MNNLIALTKIQIKDFLTKYQNSMGMKSNTIGKLLMILVTVLLFIPSVTFSQILYNAFAQAAHPELTITYMYVAATLFMFLTSIPFIVSIFFYSKDLKFLASLPVREDTLIFSKLSTVYIYLLGLSTILIVPSFVIYGINSGISFSLIFFGLLVLLISPLLPLLISAVVIIFFTRLISNSRRRNLFSIIAGLLLFGIIIGMQIAISKYQMQPENLQEIFTTQEGLLAYVGLRFPPSVWMTKMLFGSFKDTIMFLGINVLFFFILQQLAKVFYRRAMVAFNQGGVAVKSGKIYYQKRSIGVQLIRRHILIILKQPTFFLNTILSLLVPIIMFAMMLIMGETSMEMLISPEAAPFLLLIFVGIISTPAIIANLSATAITREGKAFWETKILPVSFRDNLKYRVATTLILDFAGSAVLLILSLFILPITLKTVILGSLFCITLTLFLATADIIVNVYRPLLNWSHPTAAVKNNFNVMISLGIRFVVGILGYLLFITFPIIDLGFENIVFGASIVFLLLYFLVRHYVYHYLPARFAKISV